MKKVLENIKETYENLTNKLKEIKIQENEERKEGEKLALDYKVCDDKFQTSSDQFNKIENRIKKKKEKYVIRRNSRHFKIVTLLTLASSLLIALININIGLIAQPLYAILGCVGLSCIAGMIDLSIFWNKLTPKYEKDFEDLESTQNSRRISDKAYTNKLRHEQELRNVQSKIITHTKKLNKTIRKRQEIESQINKLKQSTFDQIFEKEYRRFDVIALPESRNHAFVMNQEDASSHADEQTLAETQKRAQEFEKNNLGGPKLTLNK